MDLESKCKDKLVHLRIKELKDILTQLGLSKQGKKMDLVERILSILSDDKVPRMWTKCSKEEIAKLIDDTYRKMHILCASDLGTKSFSAVSNVKPKEEVVETFKKIRCPCGISLETEPIIQCDDPKCHAWQHISCVVLTEKPLDGLPQLPDTFYCEICRVVRADPFWLTLGHALSPVKLGTLNVPGDGATTFQAVDRTFQLTRADRDLLSKQEFDIQAWCILINDKVPFRMQWPQYADLQVNGIPIRTMNRPGSQLLGANGRDDGALISLCTKDGINKISLTARDTRIFCLGVRIVKRRTYQEILNSVPKEAMGEPFDDALERVRRCAGCGANTNAAGDDSDVELVTDSIPFSLRCPMSGSRIKIAGRFKPCAHMGCFDLEAFVQINERTRKWQCPVCMKNYSLENLIIDPYFNRITSLLRYCSEDVTEIELKPDAYWRPKPGTVVGELALWHLPDGSICAPETSTKTEASTRVKTEGVSEGHAGLKLGLKKNRDGFWEVSMPYGLHAFPNGSQLQEGENVIHMASSATSSGQDGDEASVNQDGSRNLDSALPRTELDHSSLGNDDVIILSDSEDNGANRFSAAARCTVGQLGLFANNGDDMGNFWQFSSAPPDPCFQLFGSDADVPNALMELQQSCNLPPCPATQLSNPLAFPGTDPSMQMFLPQPDIQGQASTSNGIREEDWISLRLGGASIRPVDLAGVPPQIDPSGDLGDTGGREKEMRERSDSGNSPFEFPRQRRSVRPRLYFSIDSDTE